MLRVKEDLGRKKLRRPCLAVDPLGGNLLADPVISEFDEDVGTGVPLLPRLGEIPNEDVVRLQIAEENVSGVKICHRICYLRRDKNILNKSLSFALILECSYSSQNALKRNLLLVSEVVALHTWVKVALRVRLLNLLFFFW